MPFTCTLRFEATVKRRIVCFMMKGMGVLTSSLLCQVDGAFATFLLRLEQLTEAVEELHGLDQ